MKSVRCDWKEKSAHVVHRNRQLRKINLLHISIPFLYFDFITHFIRILLYHFFGQFQHVVVVRVGLIQLNGRELGVVPRAQAFVAPDAPELEHFFKPAHHLSSSSLPYKRVYISTNICIRKHLGA